MTHKFPEARLESLCEEIVDCPHSTPKWTDSGEVVIRNQNIRRGRLDLSTTSYTDEENYQKRSKRIELRPNDLIITREAPMGEVCIVPEGLRCCLGQRMVALRTDSKKIIPRYLLFALQGRDVQHQIGFNEGTGSTVSNMRIPVLKGLDIPVPDLSNQKAIAHILGTLDDKIELNQKMNQTVEEIAKAIFKSWFVDFDPVRAKAEGRPTGLPPEISDLFPDELVDSEIGEIPKGWDVTNFGEITSKETLKVKKFSEEVKVLSAVSSGRLRLSEEYFTKQVFSKNIGNYYVVPKFSFAYNPSRINIGSIGLNLFNFSGAVSPVYSVFTAREAMHWYFQEWLNLSSTKSLIASLCSGSVRQSLKHADMESIPLALPPPSVKTTFNEIYELFMESIRVRDQEAQVLAELRGTLLPKLISGELRIPDAEKFLEEAGV